MSLRIVQAAPPVGITTAIVNTAPDPKDRCRFDLFIRLAPGQASPYQDLQRTWCYRGDKFTDQPWQMIRNLVKMISKNAGRWDRVVLYDNAAGPDREIVKIVDGVAELNHLNRYAMMLGNCPLPLVLQ